MASVAPVWQNPANPCDVNSDAVVSAIDVLTIINDLNRNGARALSAVDQERTTSYLDVNGDLHVSPMDVLQTVNFLNVNSTDDDEESLAAGVSSLGSRTMVAITSAFAPHSITAHAEATDQFAGNGVVGQVDSGSGVIARPDVDRLGQAMLDDTHVSLTPSAHPRVADHTEDVLSDIAQDVALAWLSKCR